MKTYKKLYRRLCSRDNLYLAYEKARKGNSKNDVVIEFEKNLEKELAGLKLELENFTYKPRPLKRFVINDPKNRVIHASAFRDRVIHHAIINIIGPIFEKIFISDSYAGRVNKGTHNAINRFDVFKRKVSLNGRIVKHFRGGGRSRNSVEGYCLKTDIRHYFDTIDHKVLINIIRKKVRDEEVIWMVKRILNNFDAPLEGKGMPLGNYTSQFFANVYLNELDHFVKHHLRAKYYLRYVDDFIILHRSRKRLEFFREKIKKYLRLLKLEVHPDKSKILQLRNGISFLGYRIFYHYKLLVKRNIKCMEKKVAMFDNGEIRYADFRESYQGWQAYARWANTYKFRKEISKRIE